VDAIVTTRSTQWVTAPPDLSSVGGGGGSGVRIVVAFVLLLRSYCCCVRIVVAFVLLLRSCRRSVRAAVVPGSGIVVMVLYRGHSSIPGVRKVS